jgi:hypothetical protein
MPAYRRTAPLASYYLWSSTIERSQYPPPVAKPDMVLPEINTIVGGHIKRTQPIHDELAAGYARISAEYWRGVEERKKEYRRAVINGEYERSWKRLESMAKCELTHGSSDTAPHNRDTASQSQ